MLRVLLTCVLAAGCGSSIYESRLKDTEDYFRFLAQYDEALEKPWRDPESGIELRVPKKLKPIPAASAPSEGETAPADPRQPTFANGLQLPGLIGAWQKIVVAEAGGESKAAQAYLYLLSNASMLSQQKPAFPPNEFHDEVLEQLTKALKVPAPETSAWVNQDFPRTPTYISPKSYHTVVLTPPEPINGVPMEFQLYETNSGDQRVSVIVVVPQGLSPKENLNQSMPYCLATLSVPAQPVRAPQKSGGGKSAKKGSGF